MDVKTGASIFGPNFSAIAPKVTKIASSVRIVRDPEISITDLHFGENYQFSLNTLSRNGVQISIKQ